MYRCWNSTQCVDLYGLCIGNTVCQFEDDEKYCESIDALFGVCEKYMVEPELERHPSYEFLCNLDEELRKPDVVHFSLMGHENRTTVITTDILRERNSYRLQRDDFQGSLDIAWFCNRGLLVWRWVGGEFIRYCFCPPAYYGDRCQFQSQRISLSFRIHTFERSTVFNLVIMLIDNVSEIHSYEQRNYFAARDCDIQFGMNLLYSSRPKDESKKYTVIITVFEKSNLNYCGTWEFPIQFIFLPVYRIATILKISLVSNKKSKNCFPSCLHGECLLYANIERSFCRCFYGWFGSSCEKNYYCNCAQDSICVGSQNNQSICVCPLGKYGPRCLLTSSACSSNPCLNRGRCVPVDERAAKNNFSCVCEQGYAGARCEYEESRIKITFSTTIIPAAVLVHYITVATNSSSLRVSTIKKVPFEHDFVYIYQTLQYHIIFIQFSGSYYLAYVQPKFVPSAQLHLKLTTSDRCLTINEVFNSTLIGFSLLERIKYYHMPCRERHTLKCFYDEQHLCLCTNQHHANCLKFDHNMTYDCQGSMYCQNNGHCFQDHPTCPSSMVCSCNECYYGSRCQFRTEGFTISLDAILGYHIRPHVNIKQQPIVVKVSGALVTIISVLSLANGITSTITFQSKNSREVGCGLYLLTSSIVSILFAFALTLKFWLMIFIQTGEINSRSFNSFNCITMDAFIQTLIHSNGWLNGAVAVERAVTVIKGVKYDKQKAKKIAKLVILFLFCFVILTGIHDPLHRYLLYDTEEQRTWCISSYPTQVQIFSSSMTIFHSITPFVLNLSSALLIIVKIARNRSTIKTQTTYIMHVRQEFRQHRHLIISPVILVVLVLPHLIISFTTNCMKSPRDPWMFLFSYFIACIPSTVTFITFVLPSNKYQEEFVGIMKGKCMIIIRFLSCQS
ncbi:unnamed protein product [Rotaria magnacalcarata]|uniref:Uncharacterized protein n=1 Tax=Rotaria magnacalcarata TaxID=392030 RepID=A0A815Y2E3_9BILA|nr:unnamed protein product [Rotaria magnacalcarata]CAF3982950.1 unnamed protein product [Rotaria magnacalcarata]